MEKLDKLKQLLEPCVESCGAKLVELTYTPGKDALLQVSCCKADGTMDLDTCEVISMEISKVLDEKDPIEESYTLEVCSPGCEREIKDFNELQQLQDPYVYLELKQPIQSMLQFTGTVKQVNQDGFLLEYRDKAVVKKAEIPFDHISMIRHAVKF